MICEGFTSQTQTPINFRSNHSATAWKTIFYFIDIARGIRDRQLWGIEVKIGSDRTNEFNQRNAPKTCEALAVNQKIPHGLRRNHFSNLKSNNLWSFSHQNSTTKIFYFIDIVWHPESRTIESIHRTHRTLVLIFNLYFKIITWFTEPLTRL